MYQIENRRLVAPVGVGGCRYFLWRQLWFFLLGLGPTRKLTPVSCNKTSLAKISLLDMT